MKTESKDLLKPVLEQVINNTTSWIGTRTSDNENVVTGQTFIAPSHGEITSIEIFSNAITRPGKLTLTLHKIDTQQQSWGAALGSSIVDIRNSESGKWVAFGLQNTKVDKGQTYGFKLHSADGFIGIGEGVGTHIKPLPGAGQEWQFTKNNAAGKCFSYFSLAFKVAVRA